MAGPTVKARQLGQALAQLREAAGVTQKAAAAHIECSQAKIAQVEAGRNPIRRPELIVLCQYYKVDQVVIDQLDALRLDAAQPGWWSTYGLPEWLANFVGLEHDAVRVRTLELELIPGLLQTEDYARELFELRGLPTEETESRVAIRMRRQTRLTAATNPLALSAVVSQSALQRCVAQPSEMITDQLRHLHRQAQQPTVELRVLPFECGRHPGMSGAFALLTFPNKMLPELAWQEQAMGGHVIDDKAAVTHLGMLHDRVREQALGCDDSLSLLADLARSIQ